MVRRSFLLRFASLLGGIVGLGVESLMANVHVPCPYCGKPARPWRWDKDATEYACFECPNAEEMPLGGYMFTRKANDPNYYYFFPADVDRMFSRSNFESGRQTAVSDQMGLTTQY